MYEDLSRYEKELARFGDQCAIIAGLEIGGKISPEDAYQRIKKMYHKLKKRRKKEKDEWDAGEYPN